MISASLNCLKVYIKSTNDRRTQSEYICNDCRVLISRSEWQQSHNSRDHWVTPREFETVIRPSQGDSIDRIIDVSSAPNSDHYPSSQQANSSRGGVESRSEVPYSYSNREPIRDPSPYCSQVDSQYTTHGSTEDQASFSGTLTSLGDKFNTFEKKVDNIQQQLEQHQKQLTQIHLAVSERNQEFSNGGVDYESLHGENDEQFEDQTTNSSNVSHYVDTKAPKGPIYGAKPLKRAKSTNNCSTNNYNNNNNDHSYRNNSNDKPKMIITTGKTARISLPPPADDNHVKVEMDSVGNIYVFQTTWKNSNPVESKLKVFNMHDNPLFIHKKWKWTCEKSSRFKIGKTNLQKIPVDISFCNDEPHVVAKTGSNSFVLEKWNKMSDIGAGEIFLTKTEIDCQNPFSIAGAQNYLLLLQRKAGISSVLLIMDGQTIRLSCMLNVSVDRQPKFSVVGDYLLFPHKNSFDIVRWKHNHKILDNSASRATRTVNIEGDRWVVGPFSLADSSSYILELHFGQQQNAVLYQTDRLQPIMLDHAQVAGLRQRSNLGLFPSALDGLILFYNEENVGLLQITTPSG